MALTGVLNTFSGTIEELLESTLNIQNEVGLLDRLVSYEILVEVGFNFLNHGDLLTIIIKGDVEGVHSAEEAFENLHGVAIE